MKELLNGSRVGRLSFLTEAEKNHMYEAILTILSTIGMRVYNDSVLAMMRDAGCAVSDDGLVTIPRPLVEQARESAPSMIEMFDREGRPAMELGGYNSYFGTGSDLMYTLDLETGARRKSVLDDIARAGRLCDALPNIDFIMSSAYPSDVDAHSSYLLSFKAMVENTSKPLVVTAENAGDLKVMCDIASELRGGPDALRAAPYFIAYLEPISPLEHPWESLDKLLLCADTGVPAIYVSAPMAGASAPITTAGQVAQGLAESLFGLVVHQLRLPGAPFVFGSGLAVLDMVTAQCSYNAVEGLMAHMVSVEMSRWLDLPNFGFGGTTDSQAVDTQMGLELAELTFLVMQAGSNLNHDVGYLDFGLTGSLEQIVITDEFVDMNRRLLRGVEVTPETLALDTIAEVGAGGHFMNQEHTYTHVRDVQWRPSILNRKGREKWEADGCVDLQEKARRRAAHLLATHTPEPLAAPLAEKMDALVAGFQRT